MLIIKGASSFQQRLYQPGGEQIGTLTIATWIGAARNAHLSGGKDDVAKIELGGRTYRLEYEVSNPRTLGGNDTRYFLMDGGSTLAIADAFHTEKKRRWVVDIDGHRYELANHNTWRGLHHVLVKEGLRVGEVRETTRFLAMTRVHEVRTPPSMGPVIQAFLYHLAALHTYH